MITLEGAIYTVDEVSDLLGIPRPTLYRYLREYSIPHLRQSGRISIPEDSFDRIREARDLHKEGLGTESVRRQLREGSVPDSGELYRRLEYLQETLESVRGDLRERRAPDEVALFSPTLRTILARQSLLMSAMFNLSGMVEELLPASGKRRKPVFEDSGTGLWHPKGPAREIEPKPEPVSTAAAGGQSARFGALGRRRRRGVLGVLALLLILLCLAWAVPALTTEPTFSRVTATVHDPFGKAPAREGNPEARASANEPAGDRATTPASAPEGGIPDVSGWSLQEGARIISEAGFEVAAIKTEPSHEDPETIIRTEPSAGASARPGAPVVLTMSGGANGLQPGNVPSGQN